MPGADTAGFAGIHLTCPPGGDCAAIRDHDRRKLCLARTSADISRCHYIQDHDLLGPVRRAWLTSLAEYEIVQAFVSYPFRQRNIKRVESK